ncbi:hypothetical protein FRC08_003205, partial [Ceratobasidium sp. 394]
LILESVLHMEFSKWSVVIQGPRAILYDPIPETLLEENEHELDKLLRNAPPGPCDIALAAGA